MAEETSIFRLKKRVCYWDSEKHLADAQKIAFEHQLKRLGEIEFVKLKSLDDRNFSPCDLLIVAANQVPEDEMFHWLHRLKQRIAAQDSIKPPLMVLSEVVFGTLAENFSKIIEDNWYFDVVGSSQFESLPIRAANLLRIHDHLHELFRYDKQLKNMLATIGEIEQKLSKKSPSSKD